MDIFTVAMVVLSIIFIVLIPGVALSLALFPKKEQLDIVERIGVSIFLGITPQFILYFVDKNFTIPINTTTTYMTILIVTTIGILVWQYRKEKNE
ncbi:MAG TPA: DUF1616 domain-containing protein [Candidatus Altiarchaeales archaeon]|nr:DUF1616 domain-containing protein [Candidatus Altiarchaeales archaeon]